MTISDGGSVRADQLVMYAFATVVIMGISGLVGGLLVAILALRFVRPLPAEPPPRLARPPVQFPPRLPPPRPRPGPNDATAEFTLPLPPREHRHEGAT